MTPPCSKDMIDVTIWISWNIVKFVNLNELPICPISNNGIANPIIHYLTGKWSDRETLFQLVERKTFQMLVQKEDHLLN